MQEQSGKRVHGLINVLWVLMGVVTIAVFFIVGRNSGLEDSAVDFGCVEDINEGWYYEEGGQVKYVEELPYITKMEKVTFYHVLPDSSGEPAVLTFRNKQQKVTVWVGDECVYQYGDGGPLRGSLLPSIQCFVPVGIQDGTQTVRIQLEKSVGRRVMFPGVQMGSQGAVLMEFIRDSRGILLFGVLMIVFALFLIAGSLVLRVKNRGSEYALFFRRGCLYSCPLCGCLRTRRSCSWQQGIRRLCLSHPFYAS